MQAQPRGKKRSAKENIDAGGKKPKKKEEKEEEPKPYVCAIYRRDIASFLPREKIQQWRQTSSFSNASLVEFPSLLPRFKYHILRVIFASADRCRVKKDGFLYQQSDGYLMGGKEFSSIFEFRFCCNDVKDRASVLTGQRLFPSKPDSDGVAFKLCAEWNDGLNPWNQKTVVCRVPNLLTAKTAPAMLHFLHHLSQACYKHIEIIPGATANAAECALNPLVLQVLHKFRLRGVKFGRTRYVHPWGHVMGTAGVLSNLTVEMAFEMRIRFNLLFYHIQNAVAELPQLLDFITNGRQLDKRLELDGRILIMRISEDIDQIIKHFEEDARSLEEAIRDVRYTNPGFINWSANWPARCPREAATQVTRNDDGTVDYRFNYTNAHSKEPFSLLLGTRSHNECERVLIVKFHLTFGSV